MTLNFTEKDIYPQSTQWRESNIRFRGKKWEKVVENVH